MISCPWNDWDFNFVKGESNLEAPLEKHWYITRDMNKYTLPSAFMFDKYTRRFNVCIEIISFYEPICHITTSSYLFNFTFIYQHKPLLSMWATFLQYTCKVNADVMTVETNTQVPENIGTMWLGSISTCLLKVYPVLYLKTQWNLNYHFQN